MLAPLVGDKWTLLIVRDLAGGPRRFVELQRVLPGISTEQLRSRLNRMVADGLLTRQRYREVPPRMDYELTERALTCSPSSPPWAAGATAGPGGRPVPARRSTWARSCAASRASTCRRRCAAASSSSSCAGVDAEDIYLLHAADGTDVTYEERTAPEADAHVLGPERAWVEAFGVDGSRTELEFTGDVRLAEALLDAVVIGVSRNRAVA